MLHRLPRTLGQRSSAPAERRGGLNFFNVSVHNIVLLSSFLVFLDLPGFSLRRGLHQWADFQPAALMSLPCCRSC